MESGTLSSQRSARGFTLIEMMIVVVVVAILAAIALPSYNSHLRKSRRSDAVASLNAVLQAQERWRANNATYTSNMTDLGVPATSGDGYYTISTSTAVATAGRRYVATAAAVAGGRQAADTGCTTMTITADQSLTPSIAYAPTACWSR